MEQARRIASAPAASYVSMDADSKANRNRSASGVMVIGALAVGESAVGIAKEFWQADTDAKNCTVCKDRYNTDIVLLFRDF